MKTVILIWGFIALLYQAFPQSRSGLADKIIPAHEEVSRYVPEWIDDGRFHKLYLEVKFAGPEILHQEKVKLLKNAIIKSVDLVYTGYPAGSDLSGLNAKRIEALHHLCPQAFENSFTSWRIVKQTDCVSEQEARKLYHGFVIVYQPAPTEESVKKEYEFLKSSRVKGLYVNDSTVLTVFKRSKWKNMTVVADMTGSMSPYIKQLFLWYHLTLATKRIKEFVFFNDGDMKADHLKLAGNTGGIYYCKTHDVKKVFQAASTCVKNGFGGDIPENNIEALIYAAEKSPNQKELIMIADNWSPMRDYEFIDDIKVPVRIVVCGLLHGGAVNTQYLDLARATGGSVHTMEMDIEHLSELAEGKTIVIMGKKYKVKGGRFVLVAG